MIKYFKLIKYLFTDARYRFKHRKEMKFAGFGIRVFVGPFGSGKTSSMVEYAYNMACRYKNLHILTVMELYNFPKDTQIEKLTSYKQIVNCQENSIILLDEFSSLFPASEWHKGIPKSLKAIILQVRKRNIMILGTAQEFVDLFVFFRRHTFTVHECNCWAGRLNSVTVFDGKEYERLQNVSLVNRYSFVQTNQLRSLYDTNEMINPISMDDLYEYDIVNAESIQSELDNLKEYHGRVSDNTKRKRGRPKKTK